MSGLGQDNNSSMFQSFQTSLSGPNVHFIDNFQLDFKKNLDDTIETISVSFVLAANHKLEETHTAFNYRPSDSVAHYFLPINEIDAGRKFSFDASFPSWRISAFHVRRISNENYQMH